VPGLKAPKGTMRGKMLRQIAQLVEGQPVQAPDPVTGEPTLLPSIQPSKYLDDLPTLIKLIPAWSAEHWDQLESNQPALDNLVSFYKQCVVYERELAAEMQMTGAQPSPQAGAQA
jgi:hypothetical protein